MRLIYIVISFFVLYYYYESLSVVRQTIENSDLFRNIDEFNAIGFTSYNMREPIYWATGKILALFFNDGWKAVMAIDMISATLLVFSLKEKRISTISIVGLLLSPLFVLGLCNIHRQLVAFIFWIFVVNRTKNNSLEVSIGFHLIPFLIHNSLGILSIVFVLARAIAERRWRLIFSIAAVGGVAILALGEVLASYFREGTETNTGVLLYLGWSLVISTIAFVSFPREEFLRWFVILGLAMSVLLFVVSGGSSGSRFFMLVVTATAFWMFDSDKFREASLIGFGYRVLLATALIAPTLASSFSRDILLAAYYSLPYRPSI